jgi:1-aminocyclopropane-1-carboxylate deaminase/D-cysteine desulfhydrase-like pyridoxal-dependent ACC family enzyme
VRLGGNALATRFPGLASRLPWIPLATLPTPVDAWPPSREFPASLLVKRDDLTAPLYGGNKVRKFEYLFAAARERGARTLVTLGGLGTNQGLALALHGRAAGLAVDVSLAPQPITPAVAANLRGLVASGATLRFARTGPGCLWETWRVFRARRAAGDRPYFIPAGASTPLSTVGYVAAALELAAQVEQGGLPLPERIFVAAGTCGTAAGLVAGCKLAGLRSRVTAVRVFDAFQANRRRILRLARRTMALLCALDPEVPDIPLVGGDFDLLTGFLGPGYGAPTPAARDAVVWAASRVPLDTTYTGKALAACLAQGTGAGTVLFWNTYNSVPFPQSPDLASVPDRVRKLLTEL